MPFSPLRRFQRRGCRAAKHRHSPPIDGRSYSPRPKLADGRDASTSPAVEASVDDADRYAGTLAFRPDLVGADLADEKLLVSSSRTGRSGWAPQSRLHKLPRSLLAASSVSQLPLPHVVPLDIAAPPTPPAAGKRRLKRLDRFQLAAHAQAPASPTRSENSYSTASPSWAILSRSDFCVAPLIGASTVKDSDPAEHQRPERPRDQPMVARCMRPKPPSSQVSKPKRRRKQHKRAVCTMGSVLSWMLISRPLPMLEPVAKTSSAFESPVCSKTVAVWWSVQKRSSSCSASSEWCHLPGCSAKNCRLTTWCPRCASSFAKPLGSTLYLLRFQCRDSLLMDRVARLARLLSAPLCVGAGRHFVAYRDDAAPLGYDATTPLAEPGDLAITPDAGAAVSKKIKELSPARFSRAASAFDTAWWASA